MHDEESSIEQIGIRKRNLAILEAQAARYGADIPLHLQNALDYEREQIRLLEQALDDYRDGIEEHVQPHAEIDMADPITSNDRMQAQISRLQNDMADFRTAVLVKLATIEADVRQIRDEQGRVREDLAEINDERRRRLQPGGMTAISVVMAIVMATILFAVLLFSQGAL
jgi:hypothetical protein